MNFPRHNLYVFLEILGLCLVLISGCVLGWAMFGEKNYVLIGISGLVFTIFLLITLTLMLDPDKIRARQSLSVLGLASNLLEGMQGGFNSTSAQHACEILHRSSSASAVAITDTENILGYCGTGEDSLPHGISPLRTEATRESLKDGKTRVLNSPEEVGLPTKTRGIKAAIIVPLKIGKSIVGTLKFYYPSASRITETQVSIAEGFAQLIATQIAAMELEEQKKLATSMELKALQSQINPHFLFNTINTIASFIRTDPMKARTLLREFAVFYRRTLEDSTERISLARELDQVQRYFNFELARFGDARLAFEVDASPALLDMMVPPFLVQPLVENAIKHAMPSEGKLTITVKADADGDDVVIVVSDDGVGMSEESDCVVVVVSEETGAIALAVGGKLERNLTPEQLKGRLEELLNISSSNEKTAIA